MTRTMIHVDEAALKKLQDALSQAGEDYKKNYEKLTSLIQEITSGDITGDLADELLKKYNDKKDTLDNIYKAIDDAEDYAGVKKTDFSKRMNSDMSAMH